MGYHEALEAAGAEVLDVVSTGDYQGTHYFLCRFEGKLVVVDVAYGSCAGCDAFEAEFGYDREREDYTQRLRAFGESYLAFPIPLSKALQRARRSEREDVYSSIYDSPRGRLEAWAEEYPEELQ